MPSEALGREESESADLPFSLAAAASEFEPELPQPSSEKRQSPARDPTRAAAASAVVRVEIAMGLSIR